MRSSLPIDWLISSIVAAWISLVVLFMVLVSFGFLLIKGAEAP
jgi:hypothetical protein